MYQLICVYILFKCKGYSAGFRLNASSWPMFLLKTLNGAEMAPARIFHKVPHIFHRRLRICIWGQVGMIQMGIKFHDDCHGEGELVIFVIIIITVFLIMKICL